MDREQKNNGWIWLLLSAVCWSMGGMLAKLNHWGPVSITTVRGVLSFVLYLLLFRPKRIALTRSKVISAVCYFAQGILMVTAVKITTAGNSSLLQNTAPLFIMAMEFLILKRKPTGENILACLMLLMGIALCCLGNAGNGKITGDLIAVLSGVFYAGVFFFNSRADSDALESLILGNGLYLLLIPFLFTDPGVRASTGRDILSVLAFSLLTGTAAWFMFSVGIRRTEPLRASFITMLEPVLAPFWALVFLGEQMSGLCILGGILVVVTLIVYNVRRIRGGTPDSGNSGRI